MQLHKQPFSIQVFRLHLLEFLTLFFIQTKKPEQRQLAKH